MHRWGIEVRGGAPLAVQTHWNERLHAPSAHRIAKYYSTLAYEESSPMGGNVWTENPRGSFHKARKPYFFPSGFSHLDLYLMGLLSAAQVPPTFLVEGAGPTDAASLRGARHPVSIRDVVAAEGPRKPDASAAAKRLSLGVYLVCEPSARPRWLTRAKAIAEALPIYFSRATGGFLRIELPPARYRR